MSKRILFSILTSCLLLINCSAEEKDFQSSKLLEKIETIPDQVANNIVVDFIDTSFVRARLWAKTAKVFHQRGETMLYDSIRLEFYSKPTGSRQSILTADSARIDDKTKNMYAFGRIVVVADSPKKILRTSFLEWRNKTQRLYSNEYIEIISPDEEIRGYGFESDLNLSNYKIFNVSGVKR
ncbi:MAG: LPS export ABC transporter periplasmic protein LptC [Ignavibacteria bacterium]|nr:LPS export ABC transporter periplasmic protein LptC [Ignavibacteria bacterium]